MYKIIQKLQNIPLTRWLWKYWQHEETGYIIILPIWKNPGKRYYVYNIKD